MRKTLSSALLAFIAAVCNATEANTNTVTPTAKDPPP